MNGDQLPPLETTPVCALFARALDGSHAAFTRLLDLAPRDVAASKALSALVIDDCDRREREGRLEKAPVASVDQILAAVRDAAAEHHHL